MELQVANRILRTVKKYNMLESGDKVLVAVSGGPDSMFLLRFLHTVATNSIVKWLNGKWLNENSMNSRLEIRVAHLNHCLRESAVRDADFVRIECAKLGIECNIESIDVKLYCERHKLSLEEGEREVRYDFLFKVASAYGMNKIATGHTASDQAETFLLRVMRGCGGRGLLLIPPIRKTEDGRQGSEDRRGIEIIRPLIEIGRETIREVLDKEGIAYCIDESNSDSSKTRNYVRHNVVPQIEKRVPDFSAKITRLHDILEEEEKLLDNLAENSLGLLSSLGLKGEIELDLSKFLATPLAMKRRIIRKVIGCEARAPSFEEIENTLRYIQNNKDGKEFELAGVKVIKSCCKIKIKSKSLKERG